MNIAICVIAKNEAQTIAKLISQIHEQSIINHIDAAEILVICNGCTDTTAQVARESFSRLVWRPNIETTVHELAEAGKARSWNVAIHDMISETSEVVIFVDADVELADNKVFQELLEGLDRNKAAVAISGWPLKDIARKQRKNLVDRFSLKISEQTQYSDSLNGSLYAAKMSCLKLIWLPVPIPGEDGMLSALIKTKGFTTPPQQDLIMRASRPTHYYEAHTMGGFFRHEQRMVIGTTINGWLFEYFWEGNHSRHVGEMVRDLNMERPGWIDEIVARKAGGRKWVLPVRLLTWRLNNLRQVGVAKALVRAPFSLGAALLNIWPCITANAILKRRAAASYW